LISGNAEETIHQGKVATNFQFQEKSMQRKTLRLMLVVWTLAALLLSGCGDKEENKESNKSKSYKVGVLVQSQTTMSVLDGFKAEMTKLGYTEGKNVVYECKGVIGTIEELKPEAERLKSQNLDLLLTVATPPTQAAKEVFTGTKVPILFAPVFNPVELGLVESFRNPGGNLTGLQSTDTVAKALEWLLKVVPDVKRIYVPHNPQDASAVQALQVLTEAAQVMEVELVVSEGSTPEEIDAITSTIPDDVDAIFILRASSLSVKSNNLVQLANERHLPTVRSDIGAAIEAGVLIGYGPGFYEMGEQVARMADKILKGASPATIPVENAETYLGINLQTAQTIGIEIPDSILAQAKQIVQPGAQ
jgi:putative ABC transport system substrate-binding protein